MSILVRFSPKSMTAQKYDEAVSRVTQELGDEFSGCDYHTCFGTDGNLKVSEIWDSPEQFEAFGKRLMPILAEVGIDPGQPEIIPIHNTLKR
jgi:hypothetical protein